MTNLNNKDDFVTAAFRRATSHIGVIGETGEKLEDECELCAIESISKMAND